MGSSASKKSEVDRRDKAPMPHLQALLAANPTFLQDIIAQDSFPQPVRDPRARDDQQSFPLDNQDLDSVTDQELARLCSIAPKLHDYGTTTVVRLSKSLVAKGGRGMSSSEAHNMIFAQEFSLPVPKVHRTFTADVPRGFNEETVEAQFIVMDYIPGPTVDECWNSLDLSQRELVADQVAATIETMQSKPLTQPPGPIKRTSDHKFYGPWFTDDGAGPFDTLHELEDWCNHKIDVCIKFKQLLSDAPRFSFSSLVFTHQDIAPRNLVLDAQGKVWLIDWELAGAYPPGFEQAILQEPGRDKEFREMVIARLSDRQEQVAKQFRMISYGLSVAARI